MTNDEFPKPAPGTVRLGICLSGGGFRASFFHIGVLARLAERGVLRRVEVISTVSGGSIIGALYYLHVKRLLEQKPDAAITDEDFRAIVVRIEADFLTAVQQNLVMRTFLDPVKTMRMALPSYSRSDRVGELYDELFFRPVVGGDHPVRMRDTLIRPLGAPEDFYLGTMNADRRAPVPMLQINATTLNTGRCWRFGAHRMGEPPASDTVSAEIDKRTRLRRAPSYTDLPARLADLPLGVAVAASAGVPGLLPPLPIVDLYGGDVHVQLVDGGVFDNLGISTLFDRHCNHIIVSDASAQMSFEPSPSDMEFLVLARTNEILMDRVRELMLGEVLRARQVPIALMHLRKGLDAQAIACPLHPEHGETRRERASSCVPEDFGVDGRVQEALSRVRTDLDAFTHVEAQSLMLDGFLVAGHVLDATPEVGGLGTPLPAGEPYAFEALRPWLAAPTEELLRQLRVAQQPLFKYFRLVPRARVVMLFGSFIAVLLMGVVFAPMVQQALVMRITVWTVLALVALPVLMLTSSMLASQSREAHESLRPMVLVRTFTLQAVVGAFGALLIQLHLRFLNRWFLAIGHPRALKRP